MDILLDLIGSDHVSGKCDFREVVVVDHYGGLVDGQCPGEDDLHLVGRVGHPVWAQSCHAGLRGCVIEDRAVCEESQ